MLIAQVQALLWLRSSDAAATDPAIGDALSAAAQALEVAAPLDEAIGALERAADLSVGHPALHEAIVRLEAALRDRLRLGERLPERPRPHHPVILHRDWVGARHALIRAAGTMLLLGAAWVLTGWSGGPFVLLGTSVMISLFSTFDNPAEIMRHVLVGQLFGAAAALACRWLVWPFATSDTISA